MRLLDCTRVKSPEDSCDDAPLEVNDNKMDGSTVVVVSAPVPLIGREPTALTFHRQASLCTTTRERIQHVSPMTVDSEV